MSGKSRIPARKTLAKLAGKIGSCSSCKKYPATTLHHDHLIDYARFVLRSRFSSDNAPYAVNELWRQNVLRFIALARFDAVWVCNRCNAGDAIGKSPQQRAGKPPIYDQWFSMDMEELKKVREAPSKSRDEIIENIWRNSSVENMRLRAEIEYLADQLNAQASYSKT